MALNTELACLRWFCCPLKGWMPCRLPPIESPSSTKKTDTLLPNCLPKEHLPWQSLPSKGMDALSLSAYPKGRSLLTHHLPKAQLPCHSPPWMPCDPPATQETGALPLTAYLRHECLVTHILPKGTAAPLLTAFPMGWLKLVMTLLRMPTPTGAPVMGCACAGHRVRLPVSDRGASSAGDHRKHRSFDTPASAQGAGWDVRRRIAGNSQYCSGSSKCSSLKALLNKNHIFPIAADPDYKNINNGQVDLASLALPMNDGPLLLLARPTPWLRRLGRGRPASVPLPAPNTPSHCCCCCCCTMFGCCRCRCCC